MLYQLKAESLAGHKRALLTHLTFSRYTSTGHLKMVRGSVWLGSLVILVPLLPLLLPAQGVECTNVLGLFSTFSPSHLIVHMSMMRALADRGHNVTIVSALQPKLAPHENITLILAPMSEEHILFINQFMESLAKEKHSMAVSIFKMITQTSQLLDSQYEFLLHPNVKALYERPQVKFHLMILGFVFNDFQLGVAAKLGVPAILSWVGVPFSFVDDEVGNVYDPAYVPNVNVLQAAGVNTMGFGLRLRNYICWIFIKGISLGLDVRMDSYYRRAFAEHADLPSYQDVKRRISLLFYNYHSQSEGPVRPTVPQSIEIGGVQIKEKPDPLPKELAEFLDGATEGAIFFSLGTNVKSSFVKPHIMATIFKVLSRQPMRVIWKWDDPEHKPGHPTNIYFDNWLPQDDILAHPNTKLFITHAGKGGIAEAQYHGVPMLALPVFGDQPGNAQLMVSAGFGLSLDLLTLTEQSLQQGLDEVMHKPAYRTNVRQFSALYRDRPLTARQSVVYWSEYVMRHNGAYHLQSPWLHMDFVARNNLDVYAALLFIAGIVGSLFVLLLRFCIRQLQRLASSKDKVKKH